MIILPKISQKKREFYMSSGLTAWAIWVELTNGRQTLFFYPNNCHINVQEHVAYTKSVDSIKESKKKKKSNL